MKSRSAAILRFDRVVWRYALYSFALILLPRAVPVICALLVSFLAYAVVLPDAIVVMLINIISAEPFIVLMMAIVLLLLPRLVLVLPAVALGEPLSLRHAWRITRANTLRLGLATFLCVLLALSVAMLVPFLKLSGYGALVARLLMAADRRTHVGLDVRWGLSQSLA